MPRLRRDARLQGLEHGVARSRVADRELRRAVGAAGLGQEHGAELEDRHVDEPARAVALRRGDETGQQRPPQERGVRVERVSQAHGCHGRAVGAAEHGVLGLGGERERQHLGRTGGRQRVGDPAPDPLRAGEAATGRSDGEHRRDAVVAGEPGHLLGELGPAGEVGAPRRRRDLEAAVDAGDDAADLGEGVVHLVVGVLDADEPETKPSGRRIASRAGASWMSEPPASAVPPARSTMSWATRETAAPRSRGRRRARSAWPPRSAACAGVRCARSRPGPSWPPRRARCASASPISVSAPPMTPPRPIGPRSSVTTRSSTWSVRSLPSRVVELLARRRATHDDAAPERVEVVAVDRLAELEHDVVRDVDEHRERADAGELQPRDHPRRRRAGRVDVAHDARREDGRADPAADRRLVADLDGEAVDQASTGSDCSTGSRKRAPVAWAYSRATPRIENA